MFATLNRLMGRPTLPRPPYQFYGQFEPPQDQVLFEKYFSSGRKGVFIECGAFDGKLESCCRFFEETLGWTGINIEACPLIYEKLVENRPQSRNHCVALSDHEGEATFTLAVHPAMGQLCTNGSLAHTKRHKDILIEEGCTFEEYPVKLTTYRKLIEMTGLSRVDLFVLDVEGHELSVLDGMQGAKVLPRVFCIEHGWLDNTLLDSKLAAMGYRNDGIVHNNMVYLHHSY